jgi:hypothetical protein
VTADHVYGAELDEKASRGLISRTLAQRDPERNSLVSYLGIARPMVDRNEKAFPLEESDLVLVCTDGLYRALSDDELADINARDPQATCEGLVDRAIGKALAGQDNVTVAALAFGPGADGPHAAADDAGQPRARARRRFARHRRVALAVGALLVLTGIAVLGYVRGWWPRWGALVAARPGREAPVSPHSKTPRPAPQAPPEGQPQPAPDAPPARDHPVLQSGAKSRRTGRRGRAQAAPRR